MTAPAGTIEQLAINTIRTLAMDAVEAARSGHPGTPMALAPAMYALWSRTLRYDPERPDWPGRDRFILSCGHASMLLYAVLHLAGVRQAEGAHAGEAAVPLEHIRQFRQLHSRCPGHPEYGETSGVETTTGPLGQGIGNSVGMAIAQQWLAAHFHRPGYELFNYRVWALCSDGDLMEGVGAEAASLAGHLKLSNLCWIYDDNRITIEGDTALAFSEDVPQRFAGLGWHVVRVGDANDLSALIAAFQEAERHVHGPTLIVVRSHIAWGAPNKQDTHAAHGAPLGAEEVRLTKQAYGWPEQAQFLVPDEVREHFAELVGSRGRRLREAWEQQFACYERAYPELAARWRAMQARQLPPGWEEALPTFAADAKGLATRVSSGKVLNAVAKRVPWLLGGSADLAPSTMTLLEGERSFSAEERLGRNLHFGVREHAMAAAVNGMVLSGLRAYGATFFVFSDYLRPALRLAALMRLPSLFIFTHDSIGVGEDGPTHQPVEHLAALRAIPNLLTIRPADANEVAAAYRVAFSQRQRPVALVLTRQNVPTLDRTRYAAAEGLARGAYVLAETASQPDLVLIATGSEVAATLQAYETLAAEGRAVRMVSMPCWELFEEQPEAYRQQVLPERSARLAVEAGVSLGWHRYLGSRGGFVGMSGFGASAPAGRLMEHFGFTPERIVERARALLAEHGRA